MRGVGTCGTLGGIPYPRPDIGTRGGRIWQHCARSGSVTSPRAFASIRAAGCALPGTSTLPSGFADSPVGKAELKQLLAQGVELLAEYQMRLAAQDTYGVVVVLQAMDAAGKDGTIRHVMSGVNPQGVQVSSFKIPSSEELDHDYLWRYQRRLPERGNIGIFNRSYYEEVLVVRVHPQILAKARRSRPSSRTGGIWKRRFREINDWEHYLTDQGYRFVKIFLNVSKEEQRRRFLARIDEPEKNWKFSAQRRQGAGLLGRLPEGLQRGALQHEHAVGAVVRHPGRRQAVRPCGRGRRPRPHAHRDRPAVPEGLEGGQRGAPGGQGRARGAGARGRGARSDRGRARRGEGQKAAKEGRRRGRRR